MFSDVRNCEVRCASVSPTDLHRSPPVFSYFARDILRLSQRLIPPDLWSRANSRSIGNIPTKFGKFLSDCPAPLPDASTPHHTLTQPVLLRRQARTHGFGIWHRVIWWICAIILWRISAGYTYQPEDGGRNPFRNICTSIPNYTASHRRKQ